MAAEVTGTVIPYALSGAATPGVQNIVVPNDALAVAFFSSWYGSAGTTQTITTNFTAALDGTPNVINSALVAATDEYIFRGWAKVTGTGNKTFTVTWSNSQAEGPLLFPVFIRGINPDVPPRDWDGAQARNTTTTPAITLDTNTGDLVLVMHRQYSSGGAIPGLIAGTTSLATLGHRSQGGRLAIVNAPGATSTTLTSTVNSYAGIAAIVFAAGSGADTVSPVMSGAIVATRISDTSYSVTGWGASDNVGVTGYQIRVNAGAWVDIGLLTTHTFTGRTYQATDTVEVRAYDAAGNYSLPRSKTVIVGAVMVPISALDCAGNLETGSNVQLQWRSVDGAMPPHKTSLVLAWEFYRQPPPGTEFYARWWDLPNDTHPIGGMPAGYRFVGYHPFPSTPNTNHVFEIAGLPSNDVVTLEGGGQMAVVKGQWYATAHFKEIINSGATLRHVYHPDLIGNPNARIVVDVAMSLVDAATISDPVLRLGGGNWTASGGDTLNSEAINGLVRGIRMFDTSGTGTPTPAQMQAEAQAAWINGPSTLGGVWYINDNPTPTDVADKSGQGHNPAWRTTPRPALWASEVPTYGAAVQLSASGAAQAAGTAALALVVQMAAQASAQAGGTASLSTVGRVDLAAAGAAQASGTAALLKGVSLASAGLAVASGSVAMSHGVPLAATGVAVAQAGAMLALAVTLDAQGVAQAAGAAGLSLAKPLAAAGAAQAGGTATLDTLVSVDLAAAGSAQSSGSAVLSMSIQLSSGAVAQASASAQAEVSRQLSASGSASASASAGLQVGVDVQMAASALARSSGGATIIVDIPLSASALSDAVSTGSLTVSIPLSAEAVAQAFSGASLTSGVSLFASAQAISTSEAMLSVYGAIESATKASVATPSRWEASAKTYKAFFKADVGSNFWRAV